MCLPCGPGVDGWEERHQVVGSRPKQDTILVSWQDRIYTAKKFNDVGKHRLEKLINFKIRYPPEIPLGEKQLTLLIVGSSRLLTWVGPLNRPNRTSHPLSALPELNAHFCWSVTWMTMNHFATSHWRCSKVVLWVWWRKLIYILCVLTIVAVFPWKLDSKGRKCFHHGRQAWPTWHG